MGHYSFNRRRGSGQQGCLRSNRVRGHAGRGIILLIAGEGQGSKDVLDQIAGRGLMLLIAGEGQDSKDVLDQIENEDMLDGA
jgi:hypothetical protein